MNPFDILDSILEDYASPRTRRLLHAIILFVVTLVAIWLAAEGDWKKAVIALVAAFYAAANKANTDPDAGMADGLGYYDDEPETDSDTGVSGNDQSLPFE